MEKAVEIKRRAQRCVQNGDLDGALAEYEKLVASDGADPYNYVLIADLLYKKGDQQGAGDRYLQAAESYEGAGLYKNGIAVCKKMLRLSLAPGTVLRRLGSLHAAAGLGTEASLYYVQYAEHMVRANENEAAAEAFINAYEAAPESAKPLERAAEVLVLEDNNEEAAKLLVQAAEGYTRGGQIDAAEQCRKRAMSLDPSAAGEAEAGSESEDAQASAEPAAAGGAPEPGVVEDAPAEPASEPAAEDDEQDAPKESAPEGDTVDLEPASAAAEIDGVAPSEPSANGEEVTTVQSAWDDSSPSSDAPGLDFAGAAGSGANDVESILADAQEHFKKGERDEAAAALARAASAYEEAGNLDNAATIYRSLGKSAQVSVDVLTSWFENCEKRGDRVEAAHVACEIGDRSMVDGSRDDAESWFQKAFSLDESNEQAARRLERLTGQAPVASAPSTETAEAPEAPAPAETPAEPKAAEPVAEVDSDELIGADEAAAADAAPEEIGQAEDGRVELAVGRGEAVTFDLGSLISEFQRGVDAQLSDDSQSHYDLAMAYREMGLLEQALDSFRIAANDPEYANRCAEMIGRCLLDQGRFEEAAQEFSTALHSGKLDADTDMSLRYQLGLAYEAAGRVQEALGEFEHVYAAQPNYPDVALKIRVLRKSLENI